MNGVVRIACEKCRRAGQYKKTEFDCALSGSVCGFGAEAAAPNAAFTRERNAPDKSTERRMLRGLVSFAHDD